jgi:methylamine--corrinoid protein Co-methyltransferase
MGEVGHAVAKAGMDLQGANELVLKLLEKYEHVFRQAGGNPGVSFEQAYDVETLKPRPEWQRLYETAKAELKQMGMAI